ncbi:GrpB family protein [Fictibacillus sp. b24]|uniref:GrpB family protein n=1 Tax=Fictibacillus sp. b24 TaxID=3055863 RepID=UPI0025A22010|nr:GrpB family protein [Fictibacillus sp. b24]MDM5316997.1 GrpB family protein [Fictibacillus sp. b24]
MRKTEILPWTEKWEKMYLEEENKLKAVFKDELIEIYHIGSTSIPSVGYAKPIIDILIVVKDIEKVNLFNDEMLCLGYEPRNEHGITGRRYFTKGKLKRSHHIHIFQLGNKNIDAHLSFKDYLNNNPEDAKKYGDLKKVLAKQFPDDTHKYQEIKEKFVDELIKNAVDWNAN